MIEPLISEDFTHPSWCFPVTFELLVSDDFTNPLRLFFSCVWASDLGGVFLPTLCSVFQRCFSHWSWVFLPTVRGVSQQYLSHQSQMFLPTLNGVSQRYFSHWFPGCFPMMFEPPILSFFTHPLQRFFRAVLATDLRCFYPPFVVISSGVSATSLGCFYPPFALFVNDVWATDLGCIYLPFDTFVSGIWTSDQGEGLPTLHGVSQPLSLRSHVFLPSLHGVS